MSSPPSRRMRTSLRFDAFGHGGAPLRRIARTDGRRGAEIRRVTTVIRSVEVRRIRAVADAMANATCGFVSAHSVNSLRVHDAGATLTWGVTLPRGTPGEREGDMYLFTRAVRFAPGSTREATTFVGEVTEQVRQATGLDFHAWSSTLSADVGTVVWAVFAEDLATLEQANDKLMAAD